MVLIESLTPREVEVTRMVMAGFSNEDIALELGVTAGSVKRYMTAILRKYHLKNRCQLILRVAGL